MTMFVIMTDFKDFFSPRKMKNYRRDKTQKKSPVKKKSDIAGQTGHTPFKECPVPMSCPGKKSQKTE